MRVIPVLATPTVCRTADLPPPVSYKSSNTVDNIFGSMCIWNKCGTLTSWKERGWSPHTHHYSIYRGKLIIEHIFIIGCIIHFNIVFEFYYFMITNIFVGSTFNGRYCDGGKVFFIFIRQNFIFFICIYI